MKEIITYIYRKPDAKYKSIEGLFNHLKEVIGLKFETSKLNLEFSGGGLKTIWSNLCNFKKKESTIYHITGDVHYMALVTGKKSVLTIHDVQSVLNRNFLKSLYLRLFWFWLPALFVKRITVISNFTKVELEKIIPFAKYKISVVYNPVNEVFSFSAINFNKTQPRVLLLGTKPNKNLERVLNALEGISCEVVLIGQPTKSQNELIDALDLNVIVKFNLRLNDIVEEYKACDLLCFASTYEGFGMPIIEAQSVGRPVITSNIGAMKEVAADSAFLVNPYDKDEIRASVIKLIENTQLRKKLIQKGLRNVERFSTHTIAKKYMSIYQEIDNCT